MLLVKGKFRLVAIANVKANMRVFLYSFILISMVACDKHNTIVLTDTSFVLGKEISSFKLSKSAIVVGELTEVCIVIANDLPLKEYKPQYDNITSGMNFLAKVHSEKNASYVFANIGPGWHLNGFINDNKNEVSVCLRPWDNIPIGTEISSIEISSSGEVPVQGVYWNSTNEYENL